jgi:hypothetical protein
MRKPIIEWDYVSREDELEAVRWYMVGRLDVRTKLNPQLGASVNAHEHLRHAVKFSTSQRSFRVHLKLVGETIQLWADSTGQLFCNVPEFPKLPFTKLPPDSRKAVLWQFEPGLLAFYPTAAWKLEHWGVLKKLSELAKDWIDVEGPVIGEVEVFSQVSVIPFTVDFGASVTEAQRSFGRWIKENEYRFAEKEGRSLAGARAKNNPLGELKDLSVARLLALHKFDPVQASRWAWENQPRDSQGRIIPWFKMRNTDVRKSKKASPVFVDLRDWKQTVERFEKNLEAFLVWH